jgi:hypothetical protein
MTTQATQPDIETPLLQALASLKRGESGAEEKASTVLVGASPCSLAPLVPLLRSILALDNQDLLLVTAKRLGELGQRAEVAMEELKALALRMTLPASLAAVEALGKIPGEGVLEAFIEIGERWGRDKSMRVPIADILVPAFLNHPSSIAPFIQRLDTVLRPCFDEAELADTDTTERNQSPEPKEARPAELPVSSWDLNALSLPNTPNLDRNGILENPERESLPTEAGIFHREIGMSLDGCSLPIGVDIHTTASSSGNLQRVVALELRGASPSGWTLNDTLSTVTSLVREKFDLPAEETIWLDHTPGNTDENIAPFEKTFRVDMIYFDMLGRYGKPRYTGVVSVQSVVEEISGR